MRKIALTGAVLLAAFSLFSCQPENPQNPVEKPVEKPEEKPEEKPQRPDYPFIAEKDNSFVLNNTDGEFKSAFALTNGDNLIVVGSTEEGVNEENFMDHTGSLVSFGVSPLIVGDLIDVTTEEMLFTVASNMEGAYIEGITPDNRDEALAGIFRVGCADGGVFAEGSIVLSSNDTLSVRLVVPDYDYQVNNNSIFVDFASSEYDGKEKPLRAAFFASEAGMNYFFFTSGDIEYSEDLEICNNYICLALPQRECDGSSHDLATLTQDYIVLVADNASGDFVGLPDNAEEVNPEGSFSVLCSEDGSCTVLLRLNCSKGSFWLTYSGLPSDFYAEKPFPQGIFVGKETREIASASLLVQDEIATITLVDSEDRPLEIRMPQEHLDGKAHGFSQGKEIYNVSYEGAEYNYGNGSSGTITVSLISETQLKVEFTNYKGLKVAYKGPVSIL